MHFIGTRNDRFYGGNFNDDRTFEEAIRDAKEEVGSNGIEEVEVLELAVVRRAKVHRVVAVEYGGGQE